MNSLVRWNPIRDMMDLRREFDRLFDSVLDFPSLGQESVSAWGLAVDVAEKDDVYIVKASVPGIDPDDLEITVSDNTLTVRGEFKENKDIDEAQYCLRERRYGSFSRSVTLPTMVNRDAIEAGYADGILTLFVPKADEVKPKRIAIKLGKERKTIEG